MALQDSPELDLHHARVLTSWSSSGSAWALWYAREATALLLEGWAPCVPELCLYGQIAACSFLSTGIAEASSLYLEEALSCFQMASWQKPSDPQLLSCEALTLFRLKPYPEALQTARRCLEMYEGFPKPPHVQRLKSSLERARDLAGRQGPWVPQPAHPMDVSGDCFAWNADVAVK